MCPNLDELGLDLLDKMLKCNPDERITAWEAMNHPYLKDVPDYIRNMK
jgi:cyclin-dependent kinase